MKKKTAKINGFVGDFDPAIKGFKVASYGEIEIEIEPKEKGRENGDLEDA